MTQVKIFFGMGEIELFEKEINDWIEKEQYKIIDIKFQMNTGNADCLSALVLYKK